MKNLCIVLIFVLSQTFGQVEDENQIKMIYESALSNGKAYNWLNYLSNQIGGRLSGSVQAQQAVDYTKLQLDSLGLELGMVAERKGTKMGSGSTGVCLY